MPDHLFVLVGAGASYDCVVSSLARAEMKPPRVTDLFDQHEAFASILHHYRLAEQAAPEIRGREESVAIEEFLREQMVESPDPYMRRRYRQIPLYLQHLLFDISRDYNAGGYCVLPDNYARLVNVALGLDDVVFITLNYDTLLDEQLFLNGGPLTSMHSYIEEGRNWSLIKLHGSLNWSRPVNRADPEIAGNDDFLAQTFINVTDEIGDDFFAGDDVHIRLGDNLRQIRFDGNVLQYPALSAPLGSADELSCPPGHVEFLREKLAAYNGLNLLVIGYSGLDQEVLQLLRDSGNHLRSLYVVSGSEDDGARARDLITNAIRLIPHARPGASRLSTGQYSPDGFSQFAQGDRMGRYIDGLP